MFRISKVQKAKSFNWLDSRLAIVFLLSDYCFPIVLRSVEIIIISLISVPFNSTLIFMMELIG